MGKLNMSLLSASGLLARLRPPTVTAISPNFGDDAGGTAVTITGTRFKAGAVCSVGGVPCTAVVIVSKTSITAVTGAHAAGNVGVTVSNPNGQSGTGAGLYDYWAAPTVSSITPNNGAAAGGTSVTIAGTGFKAGATVTVGGVACTAVVVNSAIEIVCDTGAHAVAAGLDVVVTNLDGQTGTGAGLYEYT